MQPPLALASALGHAVGEASIAEEDRPLADFLLANVSSKVRFYGDSTWNRFSVPEHIYYLVLEVAGRAFMNPAGYEMERGDMTTFQRKDMFAVGPQLTPEEIDMVRSSVGKPRFTSVAVTRPPEYWASAQDLASAGGPGPGLVTST